MVPNSYETLISDHKLQITYIHVYMTPVPHNLIVCGEKHSQFFKKKSFWSSFITIMYKHSGNPNWLCVGVGKTVP